MANFEAFCRTKKLISNLFFLKSGIVVVVKKHSTSILWQFFWIGPIWENMFVTKEKCGDKSFQIAGIYLCKCINIFQFHTLYFWWQYFFCDHFFISETQGKNYEIQFAKFFVATMLKNILTLCYIIGGMIMISKGHSSDNVICQISWLMLYRITV